MLEAGTGEVAAVRRSKEMSASDEKDLTNPPLTLQQLMPKHKKREDTTSKRDEGSKELSENARESETGNCIIKCI